MKAVRLNGPFQAEVVEVAEPQLQPGEAMVKVACAGICGSDLHRYQGDHYSVKWPSMPGHECSGTVMEVSPGVDAAVGQRVAIMPMSYCGTCPTCLQGEINNCADVKVLGAHIPGCFTEQIAVPTSMLRSLPENVSLEEGAVVEPTGVAVHCVNRGQVHTGDKVAVLGAGTIGMLIQQAARAKGAGYILSTGRSEEKMVLARRLGADETVIATKEEVVTGQRTSSFDAVFDAVGSQATAEQAIALARRGGRIVFLAVPHGEAISIDYATAYSKELSLFVSRLYNADFDEAIQLIATGQVKAADIITHRFPLIRANQAFLEVANNRRGAIKVLLVP